MLLEYSTQCSSTLALLIGQCLIYLTSCSNLWKTIIIEPYAGGLYAGHPCHNLIHRKINAPGAITW